ncbi:MAG: hypothetical protein EBU90_22510 [Proteobacteria bacterium]|nr:hypothetical protein [Pseudomonadota bacterium]
MIIVDSQEIAAMCEDGRLSINMKPQRNGQGNNYLFNPDIGIICTNVSVIELNTKYVILGLNPTDGADGIRLGKHLQNYLKRSYYIQETVPFYDLVNKTTDKEDYWIRCYLPQFRGKSVFDLRQSDQLESVTLDIKNVWQLSDKLGFNVEVKCVKK